MHARYHRHYPVYCTDTHLSLHNESTDKDGNNDTTMTWDRKGRRCTHFILYTSQYIAPILRVLNTSQYAPYNTMLNASLSLCDVVWYSSNACTVLCVMVCT